MTLINAGPGLTLYEARSRRRGAHQAEEAKNDDAQGHRGAGGTDKSWEDAAQQAISKSAKTVHNVKSIYIENFEATVDNGKLKKFRINAKISFLLD